MLRTISRTTHKALSATTPRIRLESTSAPLAGVHQNSSSQKPTSADSKAQAALDKSTTPKVESPSPSKKKKVKSPTDPAADYKRLLEERFGGGEAAALGQLVDGKPEGLAKHVKNNLFRLI
ncbi:hypothetical protein JCM5350_007004 [Sporobolomyces pararoseus]